MVQNLPLLDIARTSSQLKRSKSSALQLIERTYRSNSDSDYTEKIQELDRSFKYSDASNYYWNAPELSLLYGTPLYEQASEAQKIALNHLYWFVMYNFTATSETQTIVYNKITGGVFAKIRGYETIARILDLESEQELSHIHVFRKICYQMLKALLGKEAFKEPLKDKLYQSSYQSWAEKASQYQYYALRFLANRMLKGKEQYYSEHLKELEQKDNFPPAFSTGFMGEGLAPRALLQFFSFNWGQSPFLASHYYTLRFMANLGLKHTEHSNSKYFKKLKKQGKPIPAPTAIAYYHFLDEAFHTTTSRLMARELYKDFPQPTPYEKFIANLAFYRLQNRIWKGLSAVVPDRHRPDDYPVMSFIYKVLQSPLFGMSSQEALYWMEKSLCQRHRGLEQNVKFHENLCQEFRRTFESIDYLWSVNRDMKAMAAGGKIEPAIGRNKKTFQQFSKLVTA
ncbi:hypothetical protein [Myxosarcina sp. GI1(2024)]